MSGLESSPSQAWTKPSQVMKVRMKRQRRSTSDLGSQGSFSDRSQARLKSASQLAADGAGGRSGKRRNPFGSGGVGNASRRRVHTCSEVVGAERLEEKENGDGGGPQRLFSALDSQHDEVFSEEACQRVSAAINSLEAEDNKPSPSHRKKRKSSESSPVPSGESELTADWCVRTRLRFTSHNSFAWCQPIRMKEEARGLASFVHGEVDSDVQEQVSEEESRWRSQLQQSTMCWIHPNLPWITLFPRIVPEPKKFKPSVATKDPAIATALMASWSESFRSVFQLLRSGYCPYFYLCTHHFTVLFRGAGLAATPLIHALLSPTTRGLREALKIEGISFSMPLNEDPPCMNETDRTTSPDGAPSVQNGMAPDRCQSDEVSSVCATNEQDCKEKVENTEEQDLEEEEEEDILRSPTKASSWLQSMGLDRTNFPSLEPSRVKFQTDQLLKLDNRPQSLVFIEGSDTQALYNFLLNSRTVMTSVGPLADIPPTILSPVAFKGATLNSCKIKSGVMKQQSRQSALEEVSSLEVTGPIMPHNVHDLCTLLRSTQEGAFHMACSNHEATAPFTTSTHALNTKSDSLHSGHESRLQQLKHNCRLSDSLMNYMSGKCATDAPVKETVCKGGLYS